MPQVPTPTHVSTAVDKTDPKKLLVSWKGQDTGGNGTFAIRFARRGDPKTLAQPETAPVKVTTPAADQPWTTTITLADADLAKDYRDKWQAQVQALADADGDASEWGRQIYWVFGFSLTVNVGKKPITLTQVPGRQSIYRLAAPLTIKWTDIKAFADNLGIKNIPTNYPNGKPIGASLTLETFELDVAKKLFTLALALDLKWDGFLPGFEIDRMGLLIERTDNPPTATGGATAAPAA